MLFGRQNMPGNNLPIPVTSFVGRVKEIAEVKKLLTQTRLLTLTGSGGCGKTRLALKIAMDVLDAFPNGVWFIDLAPLSDPALVPQTIASVFDLRQGSDTPVTALLHNFLRDKNLLLILDNCEHLVQASAELADRLLQTCPALEILATSRELLNVPGETLYRIPSLPLADAEHLSSLRTLAQTDAIRLFVERAGSVRTDFSLSDQNAPGIAQICARLDGMPLAIELAASRVEVLSVEQIAERLDDRFRLLTAGRRTAPSRQQTLRAAMDWSYDLLSEQERVLLRRLSVFAGGWSLEAAEAVCSDKGIETKSVLDVQTQLVDKSLVTAEERDSAMRYRMLETIRQYAQEKLSESGEIEKRRDQHLAYFVKYAEEAEPRLTSADRDTWWRRLEADYNNVRAALERSQTKDDPEIMLRLAGALTWFWFHSNYVSEGRQWLERALARVDTSRPITAARAIALFGAGRLASAVGPLSVARARLAESVILFKQLGDRRHTAYALTSLGFTMARDGDYAIARVRAEESVPIARELHDKWLLAFALAGLGDILAPSNYPGARLLLEEALVLAREQSEKFLIARILAYLSEVDLCEGDFVRARERRQEMLTLFRELGSKHGVAWALGALGEIARSEGDYERAAVLYEESLSLFLEVGLSPGWNLHNLGAVAHHRGDTARALDLFKRSLIERKKEGEKEGMAEALAGLAGVAAEMGQPLRTARLFGAAESLREAIPLPIRPYNRAPYDRYLPMARAQLDEAAFNAAWVEGRAMTLEQVTEYALTDAMPPPDVTLQIDVLSPSRAAKRAFGGLTAREREIAALIAQGKSNRAIANELVVGVKTVEAHITRILDKLGFASRAQIAGWAISRGLADAPQDLDTRTRES
jgi:predicted ATPase/DNA-binding CsgD family transcriptional regulator